MKNLLFVLAFLCLQLNTYAQESIAIENGQSYLTELFSELHSEQISTDILYGQSMIGFAQSYYDYWSEQDSALHTLLSSSLLYRSMYENRFLTYLPPSEGHQISWKTSLYLEVRKT